MSLLVLGYLVWSQSAIETQERVRGEIVDQAHVEYAEDRVERLCHDLEPDALRECVLEQLASAREQVRAEQDLRAQETMARWARWVGFTAVAGVVFGALSAGGIVLTLRAQKRYSEAQMQAYVCVRGAEIYWRKDGMPAFRIFLSNEGESPGLRLRLGGEVEALRAGARPKETPSLQVIKEYPYIVRGTQRDAFSIHDRAKVDREKAIRGEVEKVKNAPTDFTLFLSGSVYYESIFEQRFVTDFEFYTPKIDPPRPGGRQALTMVTPRRNLRAFERQP